MAGRDHGNEHGRSATIRPTRTGLTDASPLLKEGKISMVKIVEILFVMEAKDDTMAASKAANTNPLMPIGSRVMACG